METENEGMTIEALQYNEVYKYLRMEQSKTTEASRMKEKLKQEYIKRIKAICKTILNRKNVIKAINTMATPIF